MAELKLTIKKLPSKKAPGEDGIFNQFLKHFDRPLWQEILTLSNLIWTTGEFLALSHIPLFVPSLDKEQNHLKNAAATD